ncbi:reverse transcriptase-like protein [Porphyrobacter sp. YT40]|nr:reverse transcriptase-like protein [Porphyrobacter sp. YT40]
MEVAVVARGVAHFYDDLGTGTSSDAEWTALHIALQVAQSLNAEEFDLIGDSLEVVRQANGASRPGSEAAAAHLARYKAAATHRRPRQIRWTPRGQNLAGIALAGRNR